MMRAPFVPLFVVVLHTCSQAPGDSGASGGSTVAYAATPAGATAPPASPAASPAGSPSAWHAAEAESDFTIPAEKFSDAAHNFEEARSALLADYYDVGVTEDDLYRAAVAGMLERVDPRMRKWNRLLAPSELAELRSDLQGELVGIGIGIDLDPATGYIDVKRVYPGTPADRAGVAPPDKIVTVNGKLYRGLSLRDVVGDIRGKAGETVTLSILRGDKLVSVPLVREHVVFDEVRPLMLAGDVGYVNIPAFNARTPPSLHAALASLVARSARALVVDLRHSPGGSFDDAVTAVGELVPAGSTVVSLSKRGKLEPIASKTKPTVLDTPIAVLVDHETASSAELVTAALQELRHATVVGSRTKGKWTVQRVDDLSNGYAIKYTVALFTSPGGRSYDGTGMAPDIEVDQADDVTERAQMDADPVRRVAEDGQLRTALAVLARSR